VGYRIDSGTGFELLGHRFFDEASGRLINRDPIGYSRGLNIYGFVLDDPQRWIDPKGFCSIPPPGQGDCQPSPTGDPFAWPEGIGGAIGGALGGIGGNWIGGGIGFIVGGPAGAVAGAVIGGAIGGCVGGAGGVAGGAMSTPDFWDCPGTPDEQAGQNTAMEIGCVGGAIGGALSGMLGGFGGAFVGTGLVLD